MTDAVGSLAPVRAGGRAVPRGVVVPLLLAGAWLAVVDTGLVHQPLLVPLHRILAAPFVDENGRRLWLALGVSLMRVMTGFTLGAALGIVLGVILGNSRKGRQAISPTLHAVRQIALFAWIPLLTAWFGNGEPAKIVFIAISAFFPAFLNTELGVRNLPHGLRDVASALRLTRLTRITRFVLPGALPAILLGAEVGLLTAWIGTVGAEYAIGSGVGLGSFLVAARELFRMDLVLVGVLYLALVGYAFSALSRWLLRRLIPWQTT